MRPSMFVGGKRSGKVGLFTKTFSNYLFQALSSYPLFFPSQDMALGQGRWAKDEDYDEKKEIKLPFTWLVEL